MSTQAPVAPAPAEGTAQATTFEPVIIGFTCNWCSYRAADLAGTARTKYEPNVRLIRLMCSGRLDPTFVLKAFAEGADAVLVSGCHPGECHYIEQNYKALRRFQLLHRTHRGSRHRAGAAPARVGQRRRRRASGQRDQPRNRRSSGPGPAQLASGQHRRPRRRGSGSAWEATGGDAGGPPETPAASIPARGCDGGGGPMSPTPSPPPSPTAPPAGGQAEARHIRRRLLRGCDIAIVNIHEHIVEVANAFDIVLWPTIMDGKYGDIEAMADGEITITLVSGSIRDRREDPPGKLLRRKSQFVVAFGSCASEGCIPGLANLSSAKAGSSTPRLRRRARTTRRNVHPIRVHRLRKASSTCPAFEPVLRTLEQVVEVDYTIPGCPPESKQIWAALQGRVGGRARTAPGRAAAQGLRPSAPETDRVRRCARSATSSTSHEFVRIQQVASFDPESLPARAGPAVQRSGDPQRLRGPAARPPEPRASAATEPPKEWSTTAPA